MLSPSNLLSLALLYICLLFAVAWFTDHNSDAGTARRGARWRAWIYALSITVYCSSWTFYGAVGSATATPWSHAPIYIGPILAFTLCWPVIRRLLAVGERHRVTSIADYIGARCFSAMRLEMQDGILSLIKVGVESMQGVFPGNDNDF